MMKINGPVVGCAGGGGWILSELSITHFIKRGDCPLLCRQVVFFGFFKGNVHIFQIPGGRFSKNPT